MTIQTQELPQQLPLEDLLKTRLWVYRFLSQTFYREPTLQDFSEIVHTNIFWMFAHMEPETQSQGLTLLSDFLDSLHQSNWEELSDEYQRLFIGPASLPAPPWESVYLSEEQIILDEHTLTVREFYREWGMEIVRLHKEPDDHIGIELEFMAEMTLKALNSSEDREAVRDILRAQQEFLQEHLLLWVDEFCQRLAQAAKEPLYQGVALFTPEFLRMDFELIQEMLKVRPLIEGGE